MRVWLECRGKVDTEHTSVSPSSFIYTRTKTGIHQRKYYTNKYTTMTSYKLSTIILTSLSTPKYTKNQQQPQTGAMNETPCYVHDSRKTVTRPQVRTPIIGPQCTTINNSTTVPHTTQKQRCIIEVKCQQ